MQTLLAWCLSTGSESGHMQGPVVRAERCWNQSVSCALCCVRAGNSRLLWEDDSHIELQHSKETHQWDYFSIFFHMIIFLFRTSGLNFWCMLSTKPLGLFLCVSHMLSYPEPSFLETSSEFLGCVTLLSYLVIISSLAQLRKYSPSWEATNVVFLLCITLIMVHKSRGLVPTFWWHRWLIYI